MTDKAVENNTQACIIMMSYPNNGKELRKLMMGILKQKLAKCVQRINNVKSYYLWEGKIKKDEEKIVLCKTTMEKKDRLIQFIKKMHPYETPEILVLLPDEVEEKYLAWLRT